MKIPFLDLRAQHDEVRDEIEPAIRAVIDQSSFIGGDGVDTFERDFAAFCHARHAVACANGTDALKLALIGSGVRPGDEVITVPHTFIATTEAITLAGAVPTFVDIDHDTYTLSPRRLLEYLDRYSQPAVYNGAPINRATGRPIRAVVPVHLYGLVADMQEIREISNAYGLKVIEDACQAHGATYKLDGVEHVTGTLGEAAAFSFYPGKNLGAMGEGGAVVTQDERTAQKMRTLRDHGQIRKYVHVSPDGWNGRLDTLQCAILSIKLRKLNEWNERRRKAAGWYRERLQEDQRIGLPVEPVGRKHVYHLFVVRLPDREAIHHGLLERGIGVGLHYPIPLHLQTAYASMGHQRGDFPESEQATASILSLPMFPHITEDQVDYVCSQLRLLLDSVHVAPMHSISLPQMVTT